jgi:hypothetical protein
MRSPSPQPGPCPVSVTLVEPRGDWAPADRVPYSEDMESLLRQNGYYPSPADSALEWRHRRRLPVGVPGSRRRHHRLHPREELPKASGTVPTAKKAGQPLLFTDRWANVPDSEGRPEFAQANGSIHAKHRNGPHRHTYGRRLLSVLGKAVGPFPRSAPPAGCTASPWIGRLRHHLIAGDQPSSCAPMPEPRRSSGA